MGQQCNWVWDGIGWQPDGNSCPSNCECRTKPAADGTFIGQLGFTVCDC